MRTKRLIGLLKAGIGSTAMRTASRRVVATWRSTRTAFAEGLAESSAGHGGGGQKPGAKQDPEMAIWYAHLELPYGAELAAVDSAWRRLARQYHPDRYARNDEQSRRATVLLQELQHSYRCLRQRLDR